MTKKQIIFSLTSRPLSSLLSFKLRYLHTCIRLPLSQNVWGLIVYYIFVPQNNAQLSWDLHSTYFQENCIQARRIFSYVFMYQLNNYVLKYSSNKKRILLLNPSFIHFIFISGIVLQIIFFLNLLKRTLVYEKSFYYWHLYSKF